MERPEQLRGADKSNELSSRDVDEFQQAILEGVRWIPVTGKDLAEFAARLELTGLTGDLGENKQQLALTLVGWSDAQDHMARRRLADIRDMARDKAGLA